MSLLQTFNAYVKTKFNSTEFADAEKAIADAHDKLISELVSVVGDLITRVENVEQYAVAKLTGAVSGESGTASPDGPIPAQAAASLGIVTVEQHETAIGEVKNLFEEFAMRVESFFSADKQPGSSMPADPGPGVGSNTFAGLAAGSSTDSPVVVATSTGENSGDDQGSALATNPAPATTATQTVI